ncbi:MAG: GNAT family N-acetyltransferase [Longimicrobiales bacterium]
MPLQRERVRISFEVDPGPEDRAAVADALLAHHEDLARAHCHRPFGVFLRDAAGSVVGGLVGKLWGPDLHVDQLWVSESLRRRGYATELLERAERYALQQGCTTSFLNTVDPNAIPFYHRRGYLSMQTLRGFPAGLDLHFMRKPLS